MITQEITWTEKKEFMLALEKNWYDSKELRHMSKEDYLSFLIEWIKDELIMQTKIGMYQLVFTSRYELSEDFIYQLGAFDCKLLEPVYVDSPIGCGTPILIGYQYKIQINQLLRL
jgi:hypothetical protein